MKQAAIVFNDRNYTQQMPQGTWELWYQSEPIRTSGNKKRLIEWAENRGYVV